METNKVRNLKYYSINMEAEATSSPAYSLFTIPVGKEFLPKGYNLLESFSIDFLDIPYYEGLYVKMFKVDGKEILPDLFPISCFKCGTSIPFQEKFEKLNFPVTAGKLEIILWCNNNGAFPANTKLNLTFKLKNTLDENIFYEGFHQYQVVPFFPLGTSSPVPSINTTRQTIRFEVRTKGAAKKLKGLLVTTAIIDGINSGTPYVIPKSSKGFYLGRVSLQINNKRSAPILVPIQDRPTYDPITSTALSYKKEFVDVDEEITPGANINGFIQDYGIAAKYGYYIAIVLKFSI